MIEEICRRYSIKNYTINDDESVDVDMDVDLSGRFLYELPLNFNIVTGNFYCSYNDLNSLVGCPNRVDKSFFCSGNGLTSLESSPNQVGGGFDCYDNNITDLTGLNKFGGRFYCTDNPIGSIFNRVESDFTYAIQVYQVINGNEINLKRLKYVMQLWNIPIDLKEIQKHYKIV